MKKQLLMTVMQFKDGASLIALPNKENIGIIDEFMRYVRLQMGM